MAQAARKPTPVDAAAADIGGADVPSDAKLLEALRQRLAPHNTPNTPANRRQVALAIGVSAGTLSRLLKGQMRMSARSRGKIWAWLRAMRQAAEDAAAVGSAHGAGGEEIGRIVETSVTRKVAKLCRYCLAEKVIGMVIGGTSTGKTTSLLAYCRENPSAIYIHAMGRTNTRHGLVDAIWRRAGFRGPRSWIEKWDQAVEHFRSDGITLRLLLIDDAHVCTFGVMETIRELHDETGMGVVLAGTTRLSSTVSLKGDAHQLYEQLRARVQIVRPIRWPTPEDVAAVAAAWAPSDVRLTKAAMDYLHKLAQQLGGLRLVKGHIRMALHLGGRFRLAADDRGRRTIDVANLEAAHDELRDIGSALT